MPFWAFSQEQIETSFEQVTEVLDSESRLLKRFGGEMESVTFSLIRLTKIQEGETDKTTFVSIEIANKEKLEVLTTTGVAITNSLDWSVGASKTEKIERKSGSITFGRDQLAQIKAYLNSTITNKVSSPENDIAWSLTINDRFTIALLYEQLGRQKWKYFIQLDQAQFEVPFNDGISLLKRLIRFGEKAD
jgi:hypothetical protein